jgi:hypothetical protein
LLSRVLSLLGWALETKPAASSRTLKAIMRIDLIRAVFGGYRSQYSKYNDMLRWKT